LVYFIAFGSSNQIILLPNVQRLPGWRLNFLLTGSIQGIIDFLMFYEEANQYSDGHGPGKAGDGGTDGDDDR
jgi:hypothetical protein